MKKIFYIFIIMVLGLTSLLAQQDWDKQVKMDENFLLKDRDSIVSSNQLATIGQDIAGSPSNSTVVGIHGSALPVPGAGDAGKGYEWTGAAWILAAGGGGSSTSEWGMIIGTLSNQTDLWAELTNRYTKAEADAAFVEQGQAGTSTNLSDYNNDVPFLTSFTEADPIFTNWLVVTANVSNWDTAYGWGNHATNGYLITGGIGASTNLSDYNNDVPFLTFDSDTNAVWGNISGVLANQADLNTELTNRYTKSETDSAISAGDTGVSNWVGSTFIPLTQKAAVNGVATLGANGKIPDAQIPAIAITETVTYANTNAMYLDITNRTPGDVGIVTDAGGGGTNQNSYIVNSSTNWAELLRPLDTVLTWNGLAGNVSVDTDQLPEGSLNSYYTAAKAVTDGFARQSQYNLFTVSNRFQAVVYAEVDADEGKEVVNWTVLTNTIATTPGAANTLAQVLTAGPDGGGLNIDNVATGNFDVVNMPSTFSPQYWTTNGFKVSTIGDIFLSTSSGAAYVDPTGILYLKSGSGIQLDSSSGDITVDNHIIPFAGTSNTYDIGTALLPWRNIHSTTGTFDRVNVSGGLGPQGWDGTDFKALINGSITLACSDNASLDPNGDLWLKAGGDIELNSAGGNILVDNHIIPFAGTSNTYDLGSALLPWRNIHSTTGTFDVVNADFAYVTNNASAGTEIVNYQTMDAQGYLTAPPITNTTTILFNQGVDFYGTVSPADSGIDLGTVSSVWNRGYIDDVYSLSMNFKELGGGGTPPANGTSKIWQTSGGVGGIGSDGDLIYLATTGGGVTTTNVVAMLEGGTTLNASTGNFDVVNSDFAYVTNNATAGTEVVNWQTMTNTVDAGTLAADFAVGRFRKEVVEVITNDVQLTLDDGGKCYIANGTAEITVSLPTNATASSVGTDFRFVNITTNLLTIDAADADYIEDSSLGAQIYSGINGTNYYPYSSITLKQAQSNWWHSLGARGDWTTTGTNVTYTVPFTKPLGGVFTMVGGVSTQSVNYGVAYDTAPVPVVNATGDFTFQAVPEILTTSTTNFTFRMRGASSFVTNVWDVNWIANPTR